MTNPGTENPNTANPMTARSIHEPTRHAAMTPSGTASMTEMSSVISVSERVGSRRWPINCVTGWAEKIELPRSPRNSWPTQVKNWISSGWSSPSLARIFATSSAVARSPAMIAAGSPGAKCSSAKTNTVTTTITGTAASSRRIRKTCMMSPKARATRQDPARAHARRSRLDRQSTALRWPNDPSLLQPGSLAGYFFSMFQSTRRGVSRMPERFLRYAIGDRN